jgi:thiamine-phosphate pyrophosphorylase
LAGIDLSLYAIVDPGVEDLCTLEHFIRDIISGGVTCIQVRCKQYNASETLDFTLRVVGAARPAEVPVIVNDDLQAALAAAGGVHLGEEDMPVSEARQHVARALGEGAGRFVIGASARTLEAARAAALAGADYIGVGPVFETRNKAGVAAIAPGTLEAIRREISLPLVAIGGINEKNVDVPLSRGADGIAVISALRGGLPPREAAARLRAAIDRYRQA